MSVREEEAVDDKPFEYQDLDWLLDNEARDHFDTDDVESELVWKRARSFAAEQQKRLSALTAAATAAVEALEVCDATIERANNTAGVCCCGDDMQRHSHPMHCGHSPVDAGDYHAWQAREAAVAALAALRAALERKP